GAVNWTGTITGSSGLTKTQTGNLILAGNNSGYSGATSVNAGTLTLGHSNAAGTNSITVSSTTGGAGVTGTRVALQGNVTVANALSLPSNTTGDIRSNLFSTSGSNTWSGPITLNGTGAIAFAGNSGTSLAVTGGVAGASFTGTLTVRGAATFTGTLGSTVNLPSATVSITDGATGV